MRCTKRHYDASCRAHAWDPSIPLDGSDRSLNRGTLLGYVCHPDWKVRVELVWNPAFPSHTKEKMFLDPDRNVRAALAGWTISKDTLTILVNDRSKLVRQAALSNELIGAEHLELAVLDTDPTIRYAVALNPHASVQALEHLRDETDTRIVEALQEHPNAPECFLQDQPFQTLDPSTRERLLQDDETLLALGANWKGTLRELREADRLTRR